MGIIPHFGNAKVTVTPCSDTIQKKIEQGTKNKVSLGMNDA
jgi:hypothetical protein